MNLSVILSLITDKSPTSNPTKLSILTRPLVVNSIFLLFLLAFFSTLIPLNIDAHATRQIQLAIYEKMVSECIDASAALNAGQSTALFESTLRTLFAGLTIPFYVYTAQLRRVWIAWTAFSGLEFLVFLISSSFYFSSLLKSLGSVKRQNTGSTGGEVRNLRDMVLALLFSSATTLAVGGCHLAAVIYLVIVVGNEDFATLLALLVVHSITRISTD